MKNIFLFGAGASHGSGGTNDHPPLGKELFSILGVKFPVTWGNLPISLQSLFEQNFEFGMEKIWRNYSQSIPRLMQDVAVYFSRLNITDPNSNLYTKLFARIKEKNLLGDSLISTINYECLLEIAAAKNKLQVNYSPKPTNEALTILKLHGSCNFIPQNISATRGVSYTSGVSFDTGIKTIQPSEVVKFCYGNTALYPAMSIYMKDKPLQIASSTINTLQKYWQEEVKHAENVFLIGIYPNLEDKHIWDSTSKSGGKVYYCGNKRGFEIWQQKSNRKDFFISEKFESCIDTVLEKL